MDRVNMSVAILPMKTEFGWDSATMGLVQSSFFWGYLLTQVCIRLLVLHPVLGALVLVDVVRCTKQMTLMYKHAHP